MQRNVLGAQIGANKLEELVEKPKSVSEDPNKRSGLHGPLSRAPADPPNLRQARCHQAQDEHSFELPARTEREVSEFREMELLGPAFGREGYIGKIGIEVPHLVYERR
ncbi:hypothetical protein D3C86_1013710 [compost metagenome]